MEGIVMDPDESTKIAPSSEELISEYEHLREEILHDDAITIQILGGIVLLTTALISVAFSTSIQSLLVKGILFFLAQLIACIGLWQTVHRGYSTFMIASYLRTFVEPKTTGLKWESRLKRFRNRINVIVPLRSYGELANYQVFTYIFLIAISFGIGAFFVISEFPSPPLLYWGIAFIIFAALLTLGFLRAAFKVLAKYAANSGEAFDSIWMAVRDEEK
jgi:hypothetical protein